MLQSGLCCQNSGTVTHICVVWSTHCLNGTSYIPKPHPRAQENTKTVHRKEENKKNTYTHHTIKTGLKK